MPPTPENAAANLVPSADEVRASQATIGALFEIQVAPKFVEVKIPPAFAAATSLLPSADIAIACQFFVGADVGVQPCAKTAPGQKTANAVSRKWPRGNFTLKS